LSYSIKKDSWYRISITPKEGDLDSVIAKGSKFKVSEIRFAFLSNTLFEISILSPKIKIYRDNKDGEIPKIDYIKTDMLVSMPEQVDWLESANLYLSLRHGPRILNELINYGVLAKQAALLNHEFGFWNLEKYKMQIDLAFRDIDENSNKCGFVILRDMSQSSEELLKNSNL
jgi:hypothetical protein